MALQLDKVQCLTTDHARAGRLLARPLRCEQLPVQLELEVDRARLPLRILRHVGAYLLQRRLPFPHIHLVEAMVVLLLVLLEQVLLVRALPDPVLAGECLLAV